MGRTFVVNLHLGLNHTPILVAEAGKVRGVGMTNFGWKGLPVIGFDPLSILHMDNISTFHFSFHLFIFYLFLLPLTFKGTSH